MASIYSGDGNEITVGLQGSNECDEAWQIAVAAAAERNEAVYLSDDDGHWVVYPDGTREYDVDESDIDSD